MNKQIWCLILLVSILLTTAATAYSSELENVLTAVKSKIQIPAEYTVFESSTQMYSGQNEWRFWWRTSDENPEKASNEISVTADANGHIKRYYHFKNEYISNDTNAHFSKYDRSDARIFALRFVSKVCPELMNSIEFNQYSFTSNITRDLKIANISFYRVEDKIPYYSNYMNFVIDLNSAEVIQYECEWDYALVFTKPEEIITPQAARRAYENNAGIELRYRMYVEGNQKQAYLVYTPVDEEMMVDATSGEVIRGSVFAASPVGYGDNVYLKREDITGIKFTEQEILELHSIEKVMTIAQAEEYIRSISTLPVNEDYQLQSSSFTKRDSRYLIYLEFVKTPSLYNVSDKDRAIIAAGDNSYIRATVDAANMDVVTLYQYNKEAKKRYINMAEDVAKKQVDEFLLKYMKNKYVNCRFRETQRLDGGNTYKFVYGCMLGDVPFEGNGITVHYDATIGQISSVACDWQFNVTVESVKDIITLNDGKDIIFKNAPLQLTYINKNSNNSEYRENPEIVLAYVLNPFIPKNVLAKTGEIIRNDKKPFKFNKYEKFTDIEGHYAQVQIQRLSNNMIIDESGLYYPDASISQSDFLNMLYAGVKGVRYDNDVDLYASAIRSRIIKAEEKAPEAEITREMAVVCFVRMMGFDSVARLTGIYTVTYSDAASIQEEYKGYVALARGFGIIGNNPTFNPKSPLTRAQAAVMVYNYLNREFD